jgi:hypothetical protein
MKMDTTKIRTVFFVAAIFLFAVIAPVNADWDEGDSYKMHYPQLPDPDGLDVANYNGSSSGEPLLLADDWLCTETGLVTDIHIWGSWKYDIKGSIDSFNVSIWSNDPGTNFSHPDELLWQHTFNQSEFTERYWGNGTQGWMYFLEDPFFGYEVIFNYPNHNDTWQYNLHIDDLTLAFEQQKGTTYWLALAPHVSATGYEFGWKTSEATWEDDFVAEALWEGPHPLIEGMWFWAGSEHSSANSLAFVIDGPSQAPEVPLLTPIGLIGLVSLLSAIAAVVIVRKRR